MKIVYIHGANATPESFNYIREHINAEEEINIKYSSEDGFAHNLETITHTLKQQKNIFFIAHSLGGIYSLHLANRLPKNILGAVTISTPYGGVAVADYAKYFFPFSRLIRDVGPHSKPMINTSGLSVLHPWTQIVTTKGTSPWIHTENDGVVTVQSQRYFEDQMNLIELELNHYEVVMNKKVVEIIKDRLTLN